MPLNIECPEPQRLLKRFLDESDSECPQPTKRQQLSPTPPAADHKDPQPSSLKAPPPTPTEPSPLSTPSKKPGSKDVDPAPASAPRRGRVDDWIAKGPLPRPSSAPPRLSCIDPPVIPDPLVIPYPPVVPYPGEEQRPLLEVLKEMSQSQSCGRGSATPGRNSRSATPHPDYRSILRNNGVFIDQTGAKIPQELRSLLDSAILNERSSSLSPEAIAEAVSTAVEVADSPEGNIYDLTGTAMLPIKRSDVGRGGNTLWYTDGLPRKQAYDTPLAKPKPDVHCGYLTGQRSDWTIEENAVIDHQRATRITQPAKGNSFPFFIFEMKSEAMGGTIWQAENQAAGSGACCVSAMRWLYREAYAAEDQPIVDSIAFSACVTHREVAFHVHHYSQAEARYYMSSIGTFQTVREVQACNNLVRNIFEHGLETRQKKTREALKQLYPFPQHWKKTRPAAVLDSQAADANDDQERSSKRQRAG
ncbi:hypothetical protein EPUS_09326 [Endocarpon pusillum Z07020]|uniref:DUF7924 domain-containing protein n=1 Tax=Endocarpon pusillum (strain Z07020 / HMAS-L-300199) TaxID=1263415 RepID=U1G3X1_ENDPU|nr:uncharacterized protein EPUS_09326 [Endocarpon pusillum Z07020]ERF72002.1 hypothetical protein EPUS_09326 [Endocarpon pusillum Z07020]